MFKSQAHLFQLGHVLKLDVVVLRAAHFAAFQALCHLHIDKDLAFVAELLDDIVHRSEECSRKTVPMLRNKNSERSRT